MVKGTAFIMDDTRNVAAYFLSVVGVGFTENLVVGFFVFFYVTPQDLGINIT